jgi:hypothetical protein
MSGLRYVKVYADGQGRAHFADVEAGGVLEWDARFARLVRVPADHASALHPEPAPTLATVIAGAMTITASSGASRTLAPGTAMLFIDTTGEGHAFRNGPTEALLLIARLADPEARTVATGP